MSLMKDTSLRSPEQLGMTIRVKRKEKGLSRSALAELLGVERKWVLRLEAGNSKAELGLILKALDALGVRVSLSDRDRASTADRRTDSPSRLDEVFRRLQKPTRK